MQINPFVRVQLDLIIAVSYFQASVQTKISLITHVILKFWQYSIRSLPNTANFD